MNLIFLRYSIVGLLTFIIDYIILFLLIKLNMTEYIGNIFSVFISLIFNFIMHNYWSFKAGNNNKLKKTIRYLFLTLINYLFNISFFYILFEKLEIEEYFRHFTTFLPTGLPTKIIITGIIMCWNYFLFKNFIFKKHNES